MSIQLVSSSGLISENVQWKKLSKMVHKRKDSKWSFGFAMEAQGESIMWMNGPNGGKTAFVI